MHSHFAMSSISPKFIPLIIKDIRFDNLLDQAYFATKRPSAPYLHKSSRCPFSKHLIIKYLHKSALLDVRYTSTHQRLKYGSLEINGTFPIVSVILH